MKRLIVSILFLLTTVQPLFAQDFYHGYLNQLNNNTATCKIPGQNKQSVAMLKQLFNKVEHDVNVKMLTSDKIYMISYSNYNYPTSRVTMLIWNKWHSCHYSYTYKKNDNTVVERSLTFDTDADKRVSDLKPQLRKWIETADTLSFNAYKKQRSKIADSLFLNNRIYNSNQPNAQDGIMFFTVATKKGNEWKFTSSNMYSANL